MQQPSRNCCHSAATGDTSAGWLPKTVQLPWLCLATATFVRSTQRIQIRLAEFKTSAFPPTANIWRSRSFPATPPRTPTAPDSPTRPSSSIPPPGELTTKWLDLRSTGATKTPPHDAGSATPTWPGQHDPTMGAHSAQRPATAWMRLRSGLRSCCTGRRSPGGAECR
jgi:hypothetical protein